MSDLVPSAAKLPLAVDLDGTLIHGDLFFDSMLRFVLARPWRLPLLFWWLVRGRAFAKARLAAALPFDPARLRYDERVIQWLRAERAAGRVIVLATASDQRAGQAVADYLGLFAHVFASNGKINLKSHRKAERLAAAFPDGFVYAGNERADLAVWRAAKRAVLVNVAPGLARRASALFEIERIFPRL